MINLLPPDAKKNIVYARRNTKLAHWATAMVFLIVGILAVVLAGQIYISRTVVSYEAQIEQTQEQLKVQKLGETQKRVQDMSNSLKLVVQVLSRQVLFSALLRQIGAAIPQGAILTGLSINQVQGGIDLSAAARDYDTATQVQVNLQDPANKIFQQADIINIQCARASSESSEEEEGLSEYPCNITLRALFAENNSFTFISNKPGDTR
jgi:Tfp pilus assembly protein PilN